MTELCVMDRTGDTRTIFDPDNPEEVAAARATFNRLRRKGYLAFRVGRRGSRGQAMTEFDAAAGSIILTPPLVGG